MDNDSDKSRNMRLRLSLLPFVFLLYLCALFSSPILYISSFIWSLQWPFIHHIHFYAVKGILLLSMHNTCPYPYKISELHRLSSLLRFFHLVKCHYPNQNFFNFSSESYYIFIFWASSHDYSSILTDF